MICRGCGGLVGRDCWNPQECEWIYRDMAERQQYEQQEYEYLAQQPCQGCHYITGEMMAHDGTCDGLTAENCDAMRAAWTAEHGPPF